MAFYVADDDGYWYRILSELWWDGDEWVRCALMVVGTSPKMGVEVRGSLPRLGEWVEEAFARWYVQPALIKTGSVACSLAHSFALSGREGRKQENEHFFLYCLRKIGKGGKDGWLVGWLVGRLVDWCA